jgi:DNA primase
MYKVQGTIEISDLDIYNFYLKDFKVDQIMSSPLRVDRNPSFGIFLSRHNKYLWKDFSTGECGNATTLVMRLFGLSFSAARQKIHQDLSGVTAFIGLPNKPIIPREPKITDIKIKSKAFTEQDLAYWKQFGITLEILKFYNIYSISHFWINGKIFFVRKSELAFAFADSGRYKLYQPYSSFKWITNFDETFIQGFAQLPKKGELLVITKSLKDVASLYSFNVTSIAPQCESIVLDEKVMNGLFKRFDNIVTLFDNDTTGKNLAIKYWDKYKIYGLEVPINCCAKDVSDFYRDFGVDKTNELLIQLNLK